MQRDIWVKKWGLGGNGCFGLKMGSWGKIGVQRDFWVKNGIWGKMGM